MTDDRLDRRRMRDGSRGQWLNDRLCAKAASCADLDALLQEARTLNSQLEPEPLDDAEVLKRTRKVWQDAQAGKLRPPSALRTRTAISALDRLCRLSPRLGPDAMALLLMLQAQHTARCRRGETFSITPRSMAAHGVIPGWTRERYERARDLLLETGFGCPAFALSQHGSQSRTVRARGRVFRISTAILRGGRGRLISYIRVRISPSPGNDVRE